MVVRFEKAAWSVPEFAQAVGISQQGVRDLIRAGRIKAKRLNPDLDLRSKYLITTTPAEFTDSLVDA
ncbi:hypothetical protein DNL40_02665 [Xylanimonas oleitrophica]|uniref:Helix-turn-helix domain-containing protein n=1 Tax=Xylanimonas oleitrophica TaxID=2607479 RepID=A0A2W5WXA8_9MICO|nr:hypothetical protein [Xylanimonas oleitrophica]PZR55292.1 hypothetical protein DNL40_02665 [Xylanimonas oleitrophica]